MQCPTVARYVPQEPNEGFDLIQARADFLSAVARRAPEVMGDLRTKLVPAYRALWDDEAASPPMEPVDSSILITIVSDAWHARFTLCELIAPR